MAPGLVRQLPEQGNSAFADLVLHDTYIVWHWQLPIIVLLVIVVLVLAAAALIKYLFFR